MIRTLVSVASVIAILVSGGAGAQPPTDPDTPTVPPDSTAAADTVRGSRVYFGGGISLNVGSDFTRISVVPQVGFNLTRKLSLGIRLRYEYVNDNRLSFSRESHDYGGGVFSRYRFIPKLYGHAEYSYMSYGFANDRRGVPFLYVGAGYSQPIGKHVSFYAELLVDLINDEDSPFDAGEPRLNIGIQTGF